MLPAMLLVHLTPMQGPEHTAEVSLLSQQHFHSSNSGSSNNNNNNKNNNNNSNSNSNSGVEVGKAQDRALAATTKQVALRMHGRHACDFQLRRPAVAHRTHTRTGVTPLQAHATALLPSQTQLTLTHQSSKLDEHLWCLACQWGRSLPPGAPARLQLPAALGAG